MRRLVAVLFAGWAAVSAGCSSVASATRYVLDGPAEIEDARRAAGARDGAVTSKNVLHLTDRPISFH